VQSSAHSILPHNGNGPALTTRLLIYKNTEDNMIYPHSLRDEM